MIQIHKGDRNLRFKDLHNLKYIDWFKEANVYELTKEEWNDMIDSLNPELEITAKEAHRKLTVRKFWHGGMWKKDGNRIFQAKEGEYIIYQTQGANSQEEKEINGFAAKRVFVDKFNELNKCKLQKAFGVIEGLELLQGIHLVNRCVGPFIWANDAYINKKLNGVYKADVSSAYPGAGLIDIPDAKTARKVQGRVEPTAEYPVAFYIVSGNIAEYNKYDTHKEYNHFLYRNCRNPMKKRSKKNEPAVYLHYVPDEEEITILMKYSEYNFKETFDYFYARKKEDEMAKAVMNLTIGTFDYIPYDKEHKRIKWESHFDYFGHIRAVILARHNHNMIQYYNELKQKGYQLLCIQTDSMIWMGGELDCVVPQDQKKIGDLAKEIINGRVYIHACGSYIIEDENQQIIKYQGIKNWDDTIDNMDKFIEFFKGNIEYYSNELNDDYKFELKRRQLK